MADPVAVEGVTPADVQADSEEVRLALIDVAVEAGCTDACRLLGGYSIPHIAFCVWHGVPWMKSEVMVEEVVASRDRLVAWVKALHAAGEPFADEGYQGFGGVRGR